MDAARSQRRTTHRTSLPMNSPKCVTVVRGPRRHRLIGLCLLSIVMVPACGQRPLAPRVQYDTEQVKSLRDEISRFEY